MSWYGSVARRTSAAISSAERGWSAPAGMALDTKPASAVRRARRMCAADTQRGATHAAGRESLVQVLDAQRLYAQALLGYARAKGQRYLDTVLLFEAMGGDSQAWVEARDRARP